MSSLPSLPENWESDYDGDRWFYRYKPTGLIQYIFPKPGDEYPEYVDVFSPPPELSPEEKLESHYQVKRRNTAGGDSSAAKTSKKGDGLTSATMSGPVDDSEGNFWYQPDGLMYMGPGGYTDVSPEADEDEREEVFGRDAGKKEPPRRGGPSQGDPRSFISPVISAETTPMASSSHPATATPVIEKVTAAAAIADSAPVESQPPESPEVPLLDGRRIYSPVGYMAELPSEHTAQCREETHPAPVELPTHDMMVEVAAQPTIYADAFHMAPVELPAQSPAVRHAHHTALTTPDQKVLVPANPPQTSFQGSAPVNPFHTYRIPVREHHRASLSTAQHPEPSASTGPPSPTKYQPYNPERHVASEREHRRTPVQNDHPYTTAPTRDRDDIPQSLNRYSVAVLEDVPAVLQPPQIPPKRPIEPGDAETYMMPGSNSRHESIADQGHQGAAGHVGPGLVPSVLQPAGGRAGASRPSLQDHRAHSTPSYQPYHPYKDLEQQIDSTVRLYSPPPPQDRESSVRSVPPGAIQSQTNPLDIKPGVNRANTLPTDMPALPFMGVDPLRGNPQARPVYELTSQPRDSVAHSRHDAQAAGLRNYSSPEIGNPDFPVALKTGHNPLRTDAQSRSDKTAPGSVAGPSSPDAPRKPSLPHQPPQSGTSYFVSPPGQPHTGTTRPVSSQQFHQWQGHSVFHRPPQDHAMRPHSVQNFHASSSIAPEPPRGVGQGFKPPEAAPRQVKMHPASERVISSVVGVPSQTVSGQPSPPTPDQKARVQSVDSAAEPATRPSAAARRVSLSNPSHGFIVENSAMPPPSVQSLRNEGVARQKSPSPQPSGPGSRPSATPKPRPMSMQFPPSQPHAEANQPNAPSPVRGAPVAQPPRTASPFYQVAPPSGSRGSVSGQGQQSWQTSNRSPVTRDCRSPSPAQGVAGSAPRPVSMAFQPQTSLLSHVRSTGAERAERLPAPQPVPAPQPTPSASQQAGPSGIAKVSQGRRVPQTAPFAQQLPSPFPQNHPGQGPPRPDKIPGTHASIEAVRHTPAPVPPSQVQAVQGPVPSVQSSRMPGAHTTNRNRVQGNQASQPQSPPSAQGTQPRTSYPITQTAQPQPAGQRPAPPPSQNRAPRESTEKAGALVASQNYTIASLDTRNVTAPPHMQQQSNPVRSPVAVPGTGFPNNRPVAGPTSLPSTGMTHQSSIVPGPVISGQPGGYPQPGVPLQNPAPGQPPGQYIPQMVGGHQVFYMAPGAVPQQVFVPQMTASTHGGGVNPLSHPSPAVVAVNQPQSAPLRVSSPQTVAGGKEKDSGKEKEKWYGKVFKSGSVKKQNPMTGPAVDDTASQGSGQSIKSEMASRNKLQKSQPGPAQPQPPQPQVQPMPHVQAQTTGPAAGMATPMQVMPFVQGSQSQTGQQSGPYFQPVGGNLFWSNTHHGLATNTPHVVQQQPLGQSIAPLATPRRESNPQTQTGQQNQQYRVASPQQGANAVHQGSPIGQPFQPHRQPVDQGQGYFASTGQIAASSAVPAANNSRAGAAVSTTTNQGQGNNNTTYSPVYPRKESVGDKPSQPSSPVAELNPRRPSEPSSTSAPRGSLSSPAAPVHVFVGSQVQVQPEPQARPEEVNDQGDRDSLSRKSISSSIAPSFTNSITTESAFTTAPLRPDGDADADAGSSNVGNLGAGSGAGASADANVVIDAGSMSMSFTAEDKNKGSAAAVTGQIRPTTTPAATSILPQSVVPAAITGTNTTTPAAPATASTTTTSAYYLAAQRADQLWGGRSRSNSATNLAAIASGNSTSATAAGGKGSGYASPSPLSSSSKGPSPSPPQPPPQPQAPSTGLTAGSTSVPNAAAAPPPNTSSEKSKWDSSGYDGSGWGDDDEDEYGAYGYDDYGGGGGYR